MKYLNAEEDRDVPFDQLDPWQQEIERIRARNTQQRISNFFRFHTACPLKRCRRHRRCSADPSYCHAIFWPVVPDDVKAWWQSVVELRRRGRTAAQAQRFADAARQAALLRAKSLAYLNMKPQAEAQKPR